jgi:hypothetical protein
MVIETPASSGRWNRSSSAIAVPRTSARSQAAIAISHVSQSPAEPRAEPLAAQLREVPARGDAEPQRQPLQEHGDEVRQQDDREQGVAEAGSAGDVGGPVAGVHVADGDEVARAGEGGQLAPESAAEGNRHRPEGLRKAGCAIARGESRSLGGCGL